MIKINQRHRDKFLRYLDENPFIGNENDNSDFGNLYSILCNHDI